MSWQVNDFGAVREDSTRTAPIFLQPQAFVIVMAFSHSVHLGLGSSTTIGSATFTLPSSSFLRADVAIERCALKYLKTNSVCAPGSYRKALSSQSDTNGRARS